MANYSVWMLSASNISVSGGKSLIGITQGDGTHLVGEAIRLDSNDWLQTFIRGGGQDAQFDDNDTDQAPNGAQTIDGTTYAYGTRVEAEYRVTLRDPQTDETWVVVGYNIVNSDPPYASIEGLAFVGPSGGFPPIGRDLEVVDAFEGPGSGDQTGMTATSLATPNCFTSDTLIKTLSGEVPVETLQMGDKVLTMDAGYQPIRWIGSRKLDAVDIVAFPKLRPVRIRAVALGVGLP